MRGEALLFRRNEPRLPRPRRRLVRPQDPFSIDFWFYVGDTYENVPVLNHLAEQNSGRTGYRFTIDHGKLWVSLAHSPPANMIALETAETLPVKQWTHITLTYDGSSRVAGMRLYLHGKPAATEAKHDSLTRSILPWSSGDVFDPFLGLAFGTRFREKAPVGSGIDELSVFKRDLEPLEVAFLNNDAAAAEPADLVPLLVATDPKVEAARAALTQARAAENEAATAVPQVLVMHDAPEPIPTFVLNRGVYSAHGEQVTPHGLDAVLPWDESLPQNRLGLAKWLFDARNPLTARVFVNRVWQMHFGRGIVETAEDFGSQGSIPDAPRVARLARRAIHRVRLGRQSAAQAHRDVGNLQTNVGAVATSCSRATPATSSMRGGRGGECRPRWCATARLRRAACSSRRSAARASKPYQPPGIWNPLNSFYDYPLPSGVPADDLHRRTLYTFVKRNAPHPAAQDLRLQESHGECCAAADVEHAAAGVVLENDPQYVEAYRALARRGLEVLERRARAAHAPLSARGPQHAVAGAPRFAARLLSRSSAKCSPRTRRKREHLLGRRRRASRIRRSIGRRWPR